MVHIIVFLVSCPLPLNLNHLFRVPSFVITGVLDAFELWIMTFLCLHKINDGLMELIEIYAVLPFKVCYSYE